MAADSTPIVRTEFDAGVAVLSFARAERANALDGAMFTAIAEARDLISAEPTARVVVMRGEGRHFCAGGDLDHPLFSDDDVTRRRTQIEEAYAVTHRLLDLELPLITAVHGRCAGAGLAFVLASDVRVAASDATFSADFARLGLVPDMGVTWLLGRNLPLGRALDLAMTAEPFSAREALDWGVLTRLAEPGNESDLAMSIARALTKMPPAGLSEIRHLLRRSWLLDREAAFDAEIEVMTRLSGSDETRRQLDEFRRRARRNG